VNDPILSIRTDDLEKLRQTVLDLERRVVALESGTRAPVANTYAEEGPRGDTSVPPPAPIRTTVTGAQVFGILGRAVLYLAGAFLLRALTDGGVVPPAAGFGLGLTYALLLMMLADRAGRRGDHSGAGTLGLAALAVAFPFVWETTAVRDIVSPVAGGAALTVLTAAGLTVAWRRRFRLLYWAYAGATLVTVVGLYIATGAAILYCGLLIALGAGTTVIGYARGWYLMRWPVALAADLVILRLAVMATNPEGAIAGGQVVPTAAIQVLALALLAIYLGMFTFRALVQGRGVRAFDVVQSVLAIAVGFGGATHIARHLDSGTAVLGWVALAAALAGYGVAFTVVRQRHGRGRAFFYFATLALLFLVLGSELVVSGQWLAWSWIGLGVAAAWLGGRYDRSTLRAHSAVYLALAAVQTGLLTATTDAFLGAPDTAWTGLGASALVALAATGACYALLVRDRGPSARRARRTPRFFVSLLTLLGLGYVAVTLLVRLVSDAPPDAAPAAVAVVRTTVLAVTAVGLAWAARRPAIAELGWLVYPVLVIGLGKLLFEDLKLGNPVALTVSFALFGAALIMAPRLLRGRRRNESPAVE